MLAAALAELTEPLAIAVDDAELLAREAVEVVAVLAAAPAPHLRIAVATSEPLPLPATQVGAGELAFTREECAALLGPAAQAAWQASAGRPLAIALAAGTGRAPAPGEPLDEALERLLASLDPEHRAALVDSAAAPRLDAAVLRALQPPDGFTGALASSGIPLTVTAGAIAVHPLVREVLARRFEQERPSEYRELLHARIARALDEEGRGAEAVEHWLEVPEEAAAAVARHGGAIADTAPATAARWLSRIDGAARLAPELQLLEGRLALGDGRLLDAPGPLREAVVGFEVRGDEAQAWVARLALADAFVIGERFDAAIPLAGGFERTAAPAAPMVAVTAAAALAATGAYDEAVALFERAVAGPRGAPFAPFAAAFRAAWVDLQVGALDAALERARSASAALRRDDPFRRLAYALAIEAVILEERGEDAEALETIARARAIAGRTAPGGTIEDLGARFAAGVLARLGRADEAEAELAALEGPGTGWYAGDVHVTRAAIASARGDDALAAAEAQRAIDAGALRVWRTRARTVAALAPVLRDGARGLVEDALQARPPHASAARLLALRAWLRSLEGDAAGAATGVAEAFAEAGDGAAHLLRRERPRLAPLLAGRGRAQRARPRGRGRRDRRRGLAASDAQGRRERGLQVHRVGAGGEHGEALALLGDVLGGEAVHAGDDPRVDARRVHDRERLEHGRVLEPERRLQPERERKVRRADVDPVQPGRARDLLRALEPVAGLDHHQAQRPLPRPGAQRAERADALGLVAARGDRARRLLAAGDHRHDHAGGAEVQRLADRERVVGGHAHERDRARPGDRLQHPHQRRRLERAVLLVGDDVVRARQRDRLRRQRARDRGPQADRRAAALELLPQAHRHEAAPQASQAVTRSSVVRRLTTPLPSASTYGPRPAWRSRRVSSDGEPPGSIRSVSPGWSTVPGRNG